MDEMNKNVELNEAELNQVSGGKHYGTVEGKVTIKGLLCYKYRIGSGDTLSWIAQDFGYGSNYMYLATFNGISNPDKIYAGQIIYIPVR